MMLARGAVVAAVAVPGVVMMSGDILCMMAVTIVIDGCVHRRMRKHKRCS